MKLRGPVFPVAMAGIALLPCAAGAQDTPSIPTATREPVFDLGRRVPVAVLRLAVEKTVIVRAAEAEAPRRKVKIRWQYQLREDGPRFEVGTYGSRKGAMKSRLLHVAMDWDF